MKSELEIAMVETTRYRVLVAEKLASEGVEKLRRHFEVDTFDRLTADELLEKIGEYDALVVRSGTKVDAEVIERGSRLKIIGRAGIGVDNIDVETATRKGIMVANVPESNIISAAEHTMALMLAAARRVPAASTSLAEGRWDRSSFKGVELYGKTLGIIGLGRIGALVAERASGFGMSLVGYDPFISSQKAKHLGVELKPTVEELLEISDFVTLHVPITVETRHMLGAEQLAHCKKGAIIVNVARGGVIDEDALVEAIREGRIGGAALDVFEREPPGESPLCRMKEVVATPHLGASTSEAQFKAGVAIAEQIIAGLTGGFVSGAVNVAMPHREVVEMLQPYLPLCEKLGRLVSRISTVTTDEVELEIQGEISECDTSLLVMAFLKGLFEGTADPVTFVNAPVIAQERGITVRESKTRQSTDYLNLIIARTTDESGGVTAGATLIGKTQEMFTHVLDYDIEIAPSKYMLFVRYEDRPGMIGKVGTILGANDINIESLQVGRKKVKGKAAMGLSLDGPLSAEINRELKGQEGIIDSVFIVL